MHTPVQGGAAYHVAEGLFYKKDLRESKMAPQFFPRSMGAVTGLIGAMGGLGGFFPPLALGLIREETGSFFWGFGLLAIFAIACLVLAKVVFRQGVKLTALETT